MWITIGLFSAIIIMVIIAVKNNKIKKPWITKDELTRLEDIAEKRGRK